MTYNILDDEENWKKNYAKYLNDLTNENLIKELNYIHELSINIDNTNYEEVEEMQTRVRIIGSIIKNKLDMADNKLKGVHILSDKEYKDLIDEATTYSEHYNVDG